MSRGEWRTEVALLLESCATSLRAGRDRQAVADFGTAIAYLQRAENEGERGAVSMLAQTNPIRPDDRTQRFSFSPGELEELSGQSRRK
jgi:hypothetical protein